MIRTAKSGRCEKRKKKKNEKKAGALHNSTFWGEQPARRHHVGKKSPWGEEKRKGAEVPRNASTREKAKGEVTENCILIAGKILC